MLREIQRENSIANKLLTGHSSDRLDGEQRAEDNSAKFIEVNRDVTILRSAIEI